MFGTAGTPTGDKWTGETHGGLGANSLEAKAGLPPPARGRHRRPRAEVRAPGEDRRGPSPSTRSSASRTASTKEGTREGSLNDGSDLLLAPRRSRGLAYYTGLTFELHCPAGRSFDNDVCGGGRYDSHLALVLIGHPEGRYLPRAGPSERRGLRSADDQEVTAVPSRRWPSPTRSCSFRL